MNNPKIVISGSTGWLGKELIKILNSRKSNKVNMELFCSKNTKFTIAGKNYEAKNFLNANLNSDFDYFFDFAFLTRDKIDKIGIKNYFDINSAIINNSVNLIRACKPKSVILASSGAVYTEGVNHKIANNFLYADLKNLQEKKITEACHASGSNLIIVRIFNISGNGIYKVKDFAISDFIERSLLNKNIEIESDYLVFRRYCDVTQLLQLLVKLAEEKITTIFDSGGYKIEIRELAQRIITLLNSKTKVISKEISELLPTDNYFSNSNEYELLLKKHLNKKSISIENQIKITHESLLPLIK